MLFLVTFSFMTLTLPSVIVHTFFRSFLIKKAYRRVVTMICNSLMHTSHACNFLLYVYSAPNFKAELKNISCFGGNSKKSKSHFHTEIDNLGKKNGNINSIFSKSYSI